jgi:hypothetical protein
MPNNPAPITDAALAELDRLKAAGKLGPMVSVHIISPGYEHCANLCTRLEGHKSDYPVAMMQAEWADDIASTLNAYPSLRLRLVRTEADRAAIRAEAFREAADACEKELAVNSLYFATGIRKMAAAEEAKHE